jgi:hypothetical protein
MCLYILSSVLCCPSRSPQNKRRSVRLYPPPPLFVGGLISYCVRSVSLSIVMSTISSFIMNWCSEFCVVMSTTLSAIKQCSFRLYPNLIAICVCCALTIWVTWRVSYKRQELLTLHEHLCLPRVFGGAQLLSFLCFDSCVGVFVFCLVYPMLPLSLDSPLWCTPSVFFIV